MCKIGICNVGPRLSLNHPSHRKCIGFPDLQVHFFLLQNLQNVVWSCEWLNYEISNVVVLMEA